MSERHAFLLSPYRPPTSYPVSLNTDECAAWLNGYAALWHPSVLKGLTAAPLPASVYDHDTPQKGFVYVVPEGPSLYQSSDWNDRVKESHAIAFTATASREVTFVNLKAAFEEQAHEFLHVDIETAQLFASLGYGYLMIDTLFDAMNHEKLLDAPGFWSNVTAAVELCMSDRAECAKKLRDATDKLRAAREGAYSGSIYLLEWILADAMPMGEAWPKSVSKNHSVTLIASGEFLEKLSESFPERFAELKSKFPENLPSSVDLCVGVYTDRDDAVMPVESQLWNIRRGREVAKQLFQVEPTVFARRSSAFHPQLPSWLSQFGYRHGLAVSFDGATMPSRYSSVVSWSGPDGKSVDMFTREPHPTHDPQTFFNFAYHLHQAITTDSTPTIALLHKKPAAVGYEDYLGLNELGGLFGETATMSRYFSETHAGDYVGVSNADEFFADYLDDRVTNRKSTQPVSEFAKRARLRRKIDSTYALAALHRSLSAETVEEKRDLEHLEQMEQLVESEEPDRVQPSSVNAQLDAIERGTCNRLAARVQVRSVENQPGFLFLNSAAFTRRVAVELHEQPGPIPVEGVVKASEFANGVARVVLEVPGLGFAWIPKGNANTQIKARLKTAEATTVRNEFFEADLDPITGGLRAFRDMKTRINRLGQMLVFNPGSKMIAETVRVTNAGSALGEVTSEGRIENEHNETLATFQQRIRAWMGRPVLELRTEFDTKHSPAGYPWHAYFGARFGWRDERAAIFRGVNGANSQSTHSRPVSSDYVEFRLGKERTFLFTGGLPFLQKNGNRFVDVVMIPEGETCRSFDLLIAADREHPMQTANGWIAPTPFVETTKGPPHVGSSGWLASLDLPSLILSSFRPVATDGDIRVVTARLLETAGFAGAAELRFARDPSSAKLTDLNGQTTSEVLLVDGAVPLEFSAGELMNVRVEWT